MEKRRRVRLERMRRIIPRIRGLELRATKWKEILHNGATSVGLIIGELELGASDVAWTWLSTYCCRSQNLEISSDYPLGCP
jgi:hypothetical protein